MLSTLPSQNANGHLKLLLSLCLSYAHKDSYHEGP